MENSELVTNVTTRLDLADSGDTGGRPNRFLRPPDRMFLERFFAAMSITLQDQETLRTVWPPAQAIYFIGIVCY